MRAFIIILGLVVCSIIIFNWVDALGEIEVGFWSSFSNGYAHGDSPEVAAEKRAAINQNYGLWTFLTLIGAAALSYIAGPNTEKKFVAFGRWLLGSEEAIRTKNIQQNEKKEIAESHTATSKDEYKICPFCAEKIKLKAIKCRYCHSMLNEDVDT